MLIYVARPNDHARGDGTVAAILREVQRLLAEAGIATFDPIKPYTDPLSAPRAVWRCNEAALRESTGVLAIYPNGVSSTGVPMEIQSAYNLGKPLAVIGGHGSMQLMGMGVEQFGTDPAGVREAVVSIVDQCALAGTGADDRRVLKWTGDPACAPVLPRYVGDAGWDLVVSEDTHIPYNEFRDVPCGISIELPAGVWAMVIGRSSTMWKRQLLVNQSVIDNGYRGPMFAGVRNLRDRQVTVLRGERIAQLIPFGLVAPGVEVQRVDELSPSDRGEQAFGSSGA